MKEKYKITDAELEIMQEIWENKEISLEQIVENLSKKSKENKNKNTIKTLLYRLSEKECIKSKKIDGKSVVYIPKITEKEYQKRSSKNFLQKIYHGSVKELLLNFIEEKEMTEKDIEELMKEIKK